jgi:hypothetical protein
LITTEGYNLHSRAFVELDRPERYAKQLKSHLGHKAKTYEDFVIFDFGIGNITVTETSVRLEAFADTDKLLEKVQNVLARHLLKFAKAEDETVWWSRIELTEL